MTDSNRIHMDPAVLDELTGSSDEAYFEEKYYFIQKITQLPVILTHSSRVNFHRRVDIFLKKENGKYTVDTLKSTKILVFTPRSATLIFPIIIQASDRYNGHSACLIKKDNELEYFDPVGNSNWYKPTVDYLRSIVNTKNRSIKFIETKDFCPAIGPQRVVEKPWCYMFTLLYIFIRIRHQQLSRNKVVELFLNMGRDKLTKYIVSSTNYCYDYIVRNKLYLLAENHASILDHTKSIYKYLDKLPIIEQNDTNDQIKEIRKKVQTKINQLVYRLEYCTDIAYLDILDILTKQILEKISLLPEARHSWRQTVDNKELLIMIEK